MEKSQDRQRITRTKNLAFVGVLSALVFVTSSMYIPFGEYSRLHFGNIICLLGGLLFGPMVGGLSAGIGSMLFDLSNPLYVKDFWITFLTKFAMGFAAGLLNLHLLKNLSSKLRPWVSAAAGSLLYVFLYLFKSLIVEHYVNGLAWSVLPPILGAKAVASLTNGGMAVVASVLLFSALRVPVGRLTGNSKPDKPAL